MKPFTPFASRPIRFLDLWEFDGWRLKAYSISHGRDRARPELIAAARQIARERLAVSAPATPHYHVGFVGIHDGKTANFIFVDWWADENELHHHVYISPLEEPAALEYKTPTGLSACVWDLALISFERDAWVRTILQPTGPPDLDAYLNCRCDRSA